MQCLSVCVCVCGGGGGGGGDNECHIPTSYKEKDVVVDILVTHLYT